ncbi:esterase [Flavobacterium magnum]|uniref:Esterase n=1 Tax=Flavobacterium magnum TaxID=2162713 RepID=A0A2S0RI02_9FLAO|nr:alpha/beta hydrolase-fold protein [Flavobacterium magnum]AWA30838.1 esterase [Flavobacterium magnum]
MRRFSEIIPKLYLVIFLWLSLGAQGFSQQTTNIESFLLRSESLNQERQIFVYTPWQYEKRDLVAFDVIYVFDAQDREFFDLVHSSLNFLFPQKKFIVVGITSPANDKIKYYRNSDFIPKPNEESVAKYTDNPNAENFWRYVSSEVIPYIDHKYRTTNTRHLVGHSLSASFVLDKAIHEQEMFTGFICVSPNLGYDNDRLANDFQKIDFFKPAENKFLYVSRANEAQVWGSSWDKPNEKVTAFLRHVRDFGKYQVVVKDFPEFDHRAVFLPSIIEGLTLLKTFIEHNPYPIKSPAKDIILKLSVPEKTDEAYITGNQIGLGNWDPGKIKLEKVSDFEREIKLHVQFPMEFKITKGSWETQAVTNQSTDSNENIVINHAENNVLQLKVVLWN